MSIGSKRSVVAFLGVLAALAVVRSSAFASDVTCSNLNMVWHDPETGVILRSDPYVCGSDLCAGYRCKVGNEISPACYNATECPAACAGECVYIPTAQLECTTLCEPLPTDPPPPVTCDVVMTWYKRKTLVRSEPYDCTVDACAGYRCLKGNEISPACYNATECARSCKSGTCLSIPTLQNGDCNQNLCGAEPTS